MAKAPIRPGSKASDAPLESCLSQMLAEAKDEASSHLSPDDIETLGRDLFEWGHGANDIDVRIRSGTTGKAQAMDCDLLETVGPDRPFLVDSLLGACAEFGLEVRTLFHPIVETENGPRSLIQIHLPQLSKPERKALEDEVRATLSDVAMATTDYALMRDRMQGEIRRLRATPHVSERYKHEAVEFLKWLCDERFVFLGVRDYTFKTGPDGKVLPEEPDMVEGSNLGLLRDEDRNVLNRGAEPLLLTEEIGGFLSEPESLILAKATLLSRVHRRVACDYVGVKHYDADGTVTGETRFLGLYTAEAYNESVRNIPLLRRRVERVIELIGAVKGTHNEKALSNIMESWPRDELIQTKSEALAPIMKGALHLIGRPRVRLFVRPDRFSRFVSAIVFVPREAYDTALRVRIAETLENSYKGKLTSFQPSFDGASLVRVLFQIALSEKPGRPNIEALETEIASLARSWNDRFRSAVMTSSLDAEGRSLASLFNGAFNAAYREAFTPDEAMNDVAAMADLSAQNPIRLRAYRLDGDGADKVRAKIYSRNGAIALSDCVPVFERMGLFVDFETGYPVRPSARPVKDAPDTYWVHALSMDHRGIKEVSLRDIGAAFEEAFAAVWGGKAENDGFNGLIFTAGLTWREAALCRALCAYRHQTGLDPARPTQIEALATYPVLTRSLIHLFSSRLDPALVGDRSDQVAAANQAIEEGLKQVRSLDHDRVIRRVADLINAIQRTNFYQRKPDRTPRDFISFKIASQTLPDLPSPKPFREIFVSSPLVEGVHCRFGPVARGGLRWSDRRDDFRTEVLGLVKAQQVKNAVIVPVGSKGGFYPKQLPVNGTREEIRDAGVDAYKTFITSLLDLTDNLIDGGVQHPTDTVIHDGEDPYLVVAADKGTATFSDIANEISLNHGFWLGDAFASGGSAGYDHKKMGITARGAWEAVKRHFREIGKDIQTEPFTVIGCGDMSGDVFGNGMLLSKQIRLQAAFNHMHIFVDPEPQDCLRLWEERKRIFDLPRSSWMDYDQILISEGGGIFDRSSKSIDLSPQIRALTGLKQDSATPDELIHALLKADCELLWFGGIGTYIKSKEETHTQGGDRANDGLRVDGRDLRAKVIGEGANLGLTQAGRIEAAQNGVRLNTDAIDNSAGVDSSDHEVNIKILCTEAMRRGDLPRGERNPLLASMTDDVAEHVLAHNYAQSGALSLAALSAEADHDALERLMVKLEQRGVLDRAVEGLPDTAMMAARKNEGKPLTRPEIAVIMAWTKIVLFDDLVASDIPDDPWFKTTLEQYFPKELRRFGDAMQAHRLKREIIATVLANRIIDVSGPVFLLRLREQTGARIADIVAAFETARTLLGTAKMRSDIRALDNSVAANQQMALETGVADALNALTQSLLQMGLKDRIAETEKAVRPAIEAIKTNLLEGLSGFERARYNRLVKSLSRGDVPQALAETVATSLFVSDSCHVAEIASAATQDPVDVFYAFQKVGEALSLDRLRFAAQDAVSDMPYWDRLATRRLSRELEHQQAEATRLALSGQGVSEWLQLLSTHKANLVTDIRTYTSSKPNFAQFALAADAVRTFMQAAK